MWIGSGFHCSAAGALKVKSLRVTLTDWSDYVFDPAYRLMPLDKVERYVHENHHLPDIPSAAEVEEQVLAQLGKTLASPEIVAGVSRQTGVPGRELLGHFSDGFWKSASPGERQRLVRLLLESVTIMPDCLKLELQTAGLKSVAEAYANEQKKEA